jgi:2'-5' RNA ligase
VRPASIHLTLKFLGDIAEAQVPAIHRALETAARMEAAFTLTVEGLGVFPDVRAPRVIWVGLTGEGPRLQALAAGVEATVAPLGFPTEARPFAPHLTLARVKERGRDVGRALAGSRLLEQPHRVGVLPVTAIALMRSELKPSGSVYTELCHVPLKEA